MITSTKNPRIVEARKLTQRKHRLRQDRFLVEGLQILTLAVRMMATASARSRVKAQQVFYCEALFTGDTAPRLLAELVEAGAEAIQVAPNVMNALSERETSQGLVATFALCELEWSIEALMSAMSPKQEQEISPSLILICDQLQDPGNLGTLIRTADAVGVRAAILLEPCVDPFDPKTVRGTMGSIFTVPFARTQSYEPILPQLSKMGYHLVGADAKQGRPPWHSDRLVGPVALVLGNEARGLSRELHRHLADYVSLPLHGEAESLNVSVAGGVLMYEWLRVNKVAWD
jgi:TrmH family RNA methyltransferase